MLIAIFRQFFLLGCMSFGGPAAHLGYFKRHFVDTLNWLTNTRYAQLISLSQALPGPGSSQVSFAIGVERAGCTWWHCCLYWFYPTIIFNYVAIGYKCASV
nr:chromate transporter [Pseudoalteromonas sp. WY3]